MPTPANQANPGDFARTVLMPGDPLRSKFIAENYFENAKLVNNVRGIQGYTGEYRGKRVSVMASGMGMPSMGIYSYELFRFYNVENIIRIGTAGTVSPKLKLGDMVAAMSAYTDSAFSNQYGFRGSMAPCCSWELLDKAMRESAELRAHIVPGAIYTTDIFYDEANRMEVLQKMGVLACDMETAALYLNAARTGKNALAILTISDDPYTGGCMTTDEREQQLTKMIELALTIA